MLTAQGQVCCQAPRTTRTGCGTCGWVSHCAASRVTRTQARTSFALRLVLTRGTLSARSRCLLSNRRVPFHMESMFFPTPHVGRALVMVVHSHFIFGLPACPRVHFFFAFVHPCHPLLFVSDRLCMSACAVWSLAGPKTDCSTSGTWTRVVSSRRWAPVLGRSMPRNGTHTRVCSRPVDTTALSGRGGTTTTRQARIRAALPVEAVLLYSRTAAGPGFSQRTAQSRHCSLAAYTNTALFLVLAPFVFG